MRFALPLPINRCCCWDTKVPPLLVPEPPPLPISMPALVVVVSELSPSDTTVDGMLLLMWLMLLLLFAWLLLLLLFGPLATLLPASPLPCPWPLPNCDSWDFDFVSAVFASVADPPAVPELAPELAVTVVLFVLATVDETVAVAGEQTEEADEEAPPPPPEAKESSAVWCFFLGGGVVGKPRRFCLLCSCTLEGEFGGDGEGVQPLVEASSGEMACCGFSSVAPSTCWVVASDSEPPPSSVCGLVLLVEPIASPGIPGPLLWRCCELW